MKKLTKKKTTVKVEETPKEVKVTEKKTVTKKTPTKVTTTMYTKISTLDDLNAIIRAKYEENTGKKIEKPEVSDFITAYVDAFTDFCKNSDEEKTTYVMPTVGTFTIKVAAERDAINPRTMEPIKVPSKKVVSFKAFPKFKDTINE